ncbi:MULTISPECIES: TenA family protein [unclassified Ruegeria]|uniref:TenA family protein n=1 Tax=unclassified Ruegeria TaxID=2625375 RepID=UPI0014883B33|nr:MULTISPECIES: TenA family protein [unclassified Ruegeria]NOD67198.1 TENA/THI-4 family protein [Ruegeria sp. HKCCD7303]NOE32787.1 TENA/THI-4 family protein [Ruegeria sp. HKCCD7318]
MQDQTRPTEMLRLGRSDDWQAATTHAFTRELSDGTLPEDKMRWYLQQDYQFVDGFVRLLASAIAHAPTLGDSVPAAQFLAVITGPENTYFLRAMEALGTEPSTQPAPATRAFQDLMAEAVASGRYQNMLAVLVVAEWVYLSWASPENPPKDDLPFWFAEWITLHAGEGFESVVEYLRGQLDKVWQTLNTAEQAEVTRLFHRAVELERDFFDAAYAA